MQQLTFGQLMAMLPLRIGQPLRASDLRDSIQRLYQTGEYSDIAVDATLAPAGVDLKFITKPAYFIGYFDVNGVGEPPNEGQLLVATKLTLGGPYAPGDTTAAVGYITDLLKRNGFYSAGVEPATSTREPTQEVHIDFHADPGKRAKFDGLVADGDTLRPVDSLIRSSGWKRFGGWFSDGISSPRPAFRMGSPIFDPGIPSTIICSLKSGWSIWIIIPAPTPSRPSSLLTPVRRCWFACAAPSCLPENCAACCPFMKSVRWIATY